MEAYMPLRIVAVLLSGSLLLGALLLAQAPSVQPPSAQPPAAQPPSTQPPSAQSDQPQQQPPIRVQVNEVIVPVTVTDDRGRFVSDLDRSDFHVFDEGREQNIRFFSRDPNQPVVVGFLIDLSNSTRIHWKQYQEAATE